MRYFTKFDDDDRPVCLFRVDPATDLEEGLAREGWIPAPGFLESVIEAAFAYGAITEDAAREHFPAAFH